MSHGHLPTSSIVFASPDIYVSLLLRFCQLCEVSLRFARIISEAQFSHPLVRARGQGAAP